jgi:hypothetical protein
MALLLSSCSTLSWRCFVCLEDRTGGHPQTTQIDWHVAEHQQSPINVTSVQCLSKVWPVYSSEAQQLLDMPAARGSIVTSHQSVRWLQNDNKLLLAEYDHHSAITSTKEYMQVSTENHFASNNPCNRILVHVLLLAAGLSKGLKLCPLRSTQRQRCKAALFAYYRPQQLTAPPLMPLSV